MKCLGLLLVLAYIQSAVARLETNLLQVLQDAREDASISEQCQVALNTLVQSLPNLTDPWAIRMLDATSKVPVGLFSLNFGELGQFTQCLATESNDGFTKARYCLGMLPLQDDTTSENTELLALQRKAYQIRKTFRSVITLQDTEDTNRTDLVVMGINWAMCVPSNCTEQDMDEIMGNMLGLSGISCQTKEDLSPPLTAGAIGAIAVLAVFAFLLVASTALDLYYRHIDKDPPHLVLIAFSVYTNSSKLFTVSKNSNELSCLNGVRCLSMLWVIIGHVYTTYTGVPIVNFINVLEWIDSVRSMTIISGTLSVDTFFLLAGLLLVYSYMKAMHHGVKFNIFQFYIHRYLRLTPALAALVLVTAHLMRYMGSGPTWITNVNFMEQNCQEYWWTTLLYVQNYVNKDLYYCLSHSWYLSVDMQLYIISPLILLPLWKYPKIGLSIISVGIVTFIIVPFTVAFITEIPAFLTNYEARVSVLDYMRYYYMKTHTRAAPWFIGLLLGYILAKIKFQGLQRHIKLNKGIVSLLWGVCLATALTCVYGGHGTLMGYDYSVWGSSFHIGFVRPVWALCLGWVIFACVTGHGGPVNWVLSFPIYQILNRFTYSIYLVHFQLISAFGYMVKFGTYFDEVNLAYSFWGITMFSLGLSYVWVLAFESPVVVLEKVIFGGGKKTKQTAENGDKNGVAA